MPLDERHIAKADLTFLAHDHPEAQGKIANPGDFEYNISFTLEDERVLCVKMGRRGYCALVTMLREMATDDMLDAVVAKGE